MVSNQYKKTGRNLKVARNSLVNYVIEKLHEYDNMPDDEKVNVVDPYSSRLIVKLKGSNRTIEVPVDVQQEAIHIWSSNGRFISENSNIDASDNMPNNMSSNIIPPNMMKDNEYGELPRDMEILNEFNQKARPEIMDLRDYDNNHTLNRKNGMRSPSGYKRKEHKVTAMEADIGAERYDDHDKGEQYANFNGTRNDNPSDFMENFNQHSRREHYESIGNVNNSNHNIQNVQIGGSADMGLDAGSIVGDPNVVYEVDLAINDDHMHDVSHNYDQGHHMSDIDHHGNDHDDMDDNDDAGVDDKVDSIYLSPLNIVLLIIIIIGLIVFVKYHNLKQ